MPDEQQSLSSRPLALGKEMAGPPHCVRKGDPFRFEPKRREFGLEESAHSAHPREVEGTAADVHRLFEQRDLLGFVRADVIADLLLNFRERGWALLLRIGGQSDSEKSQGCASNQCGTANGGSGDARRSDESHIA